MKEYNCFGKNFKSTYIAPACLSVFLICLVVNIGLLMIHPKSKPYRRLILFSIVGILFFTTLMIFPAVFVRPFNRAVRMFERCPDFYSKDEKIRILPITSKLEENWEAIREEAINMKYEDNVGKHYITASSSMWQGWGTSTLRLFGNDNKINLDACPTIKRILENDKTIETAFFSLMKPGKRIPKHKGPYAGILRYHLGLKIPKIGDTFINLNNKKYNWEEGVGIMFDETYPHYAHNESDEDRIILFVDVKREFKSKYLNKINDIIMRGIRFYSMTLI